MEDESRWLGNVSVFSFTCIVAYTLVKLFLKYKELISQVYQLSKLLTEEAALQFAKENGIDLVSIITTTVGGPFLTSTVPSSIRVLLSPITGDYGI